jgi:shikimate dehydrogenase
MKRACVMGWPVAHSLSPVIHGHWLKTYGIEGEYVRLPVEVENFPHVLTSLPERGFCGGNVTLPHKIEAYRLCEVRDAAANAIGAVNTVWFENERLSGANTDAWGFLANLDERAPGWDRGGKAVVIGAGGAARAIVWALIERGFENLWIVNRNLERAEELARAFPPARAVGFEAINQAVEAAALVVNTSSLGMVGHPPLLVGLSGARTDATICDIVYHPLETGLLQEARSRGLRAVDGLGMLLHQAVPGFERWFGVRPAVTPELRAAVLAAVGVREGSST